MIKLELITLKILAEKRPLILANDIVSNSVTEVANPAIMPTILGLKLKLSAKFRRSVTKIYFETPIIIAEYRINFKISIIKYLFYC